MIQQQITEAMDRLIVECGGVVGAAAMLGVNRRTIYRWRDATTRPPLEMIDRILCQDQRKLTERLDAAVLALTGLVEACKREGFTPHPAMHDAYAVLRREQKVRGE